MDPRYARRYRELHERHWWWRAREAVIVDELRSLAPAGGFGAILDVGCADGLFLEHLEAYGQPEGLEPEAAVVSSESRQRWTFHLCPFDEQFEPGKRYGLILMLDVLEHLRDDTAALRHALRLLGPQGTLLLTVPAFRILWTAHDDLNHHQTRYTRAALLAVAERAGLTVESMRYYFNWLFPIKLLVRARERLLASQAELPTLPPPALNRAFYLLSRMEERIWGRIPLPFGSSLLAVAKRGAESIASHV